jgi:membrane protease YdiL (CAAX protease family)
MYFLFKAFNRCSPKIWGIVPFFKRFGDLIIGFFIGSVAIIVSVLVLLILGYVEISLYAFSIDILFMFLQYTAVAFFEEYFFRGYIQHSLYLSHSLILSVLLSALIFTLLHIINPSFGYISALNIFLIGIVFSVMTYKTQNLNLAIGYHLSWNFFQGSIFGIAVSGTHISKPLLLTSNTINNIYDGGDFGIEGGVVCTAVTVIVLIITLFIKKKERDSEIDRVKKLKAIAPGQQAAQIPQSSK